MNNFDPLTAKQDYEDHARWLRSLYGKPTKPTRRRLVKRLLFRLGGGLVWLGQRLQLHYGIPAASSTTKWVGTSK